MCPQASPDYKLTDNDFLSRALLNKCADFAASCQRVHFYGVGEPLLHKDIFLFADILFEKENNIELNFVTNGTLITEELAEKIVQSRYTSVQFSFDGFNIPFGHEFPEKTLNGLKNLVTAQKKLKSLTPYIGIHSVIGRSNAGLMKDIISIAATNECRYISFDGLFHYFDYGLTGIKEIVDESHFANHIDEIVPMVWDAVKLSQEKGVKFSRGCTRGLLGEHRLSCTRPDREVVVSIDGLVYGCAALYPLGLNIDSMDIESIWNSKEMNTLRQNIKKRIYI